MKKSSSLFTIVLILALVISACSKQSGSGSTQSTPEQTQAESTATPEPAKTEKFPAKNLEFVAPASPGGGWDGTARAMQKVLTDQKLVDKPINVVNKPGGSGEVGWQYLKTKDAHTLAINSSLVLTNHLLGHSELTYDQFTPLAILTTEWEAVAVATNSDIKSAQDLMAKLKADPSSVKIAIAPGLGNDDHLSFVQACKTFGVDVTKLKFLVYNSGGDVATALLGNHVDAATLSVSEAAEQYKAGKFRILAVTSDKRIEGLDDVPTWKESGVDMIFPHWRGVMGPPNMSKEEIAYWDDKIGKMVESDAWKQILKNNEWESYYKNSSETKKFLDEQNQMYKELVEQTGLVKK